MSRSLKCAGVVATLVFALTGMASAGKVMLDSAQVVKLVARDSRTISSSRTAVGDTVTLRVAAPVKVGGMVIMDSTSTATAIVTSVTKPSRGGMPGRISLSCLSLQPSGGYKLAGARTLKLEGSAEKRGANTAVLSWPLGFGLFIKGGNATFNSSDTITARIAEPALLEN